MIETAIRCIQEALAKQLGHPEPGTVVYVRCFSREQIDSLIRSSLLTVPGWSIFAVGAASEPGTRWITADRAVDLREEKKESVLLLVDVPHAGAGMDGIYSAGRELGEKTLLDAAGREARGRLSRVVRDFADAAIRTSGSLRKAQAIAPFRTFEFYATCAHAPEAAGVAVTLLGLWPIAPDPEPRPTDLATSAKMVELALLAFGSGPTPRSRVESLLLPAEAEEAARALERLLREHEGHRWTETLQAIREAPEFYLNKLQPGFDRQELKSIDLHRWRGAGGKPLAWSGLTVSQESSQDQTPPELQHVVRREKSERGSKSTEKPLEVRWKVLPAGLSKGAVEYTVAIVTGSGVVLVEQTVPHSGRANEKCTFGLDAFEELAEDGKWQVNVRVSPRGMVEPPYEEREDHPLWKLSEDFLLTFGEPEEALRESVGRTVRYFSEAAIGFGPEEFVAAGKAMVERDKQGFLSCAIGSAQKSAKARVQQPALIAQIEERWKQERYRIGRWIVTARMDGCSTGDPEFREISLQPDSGKRLTDAAHTAGNRVQERCGFSGVIYREQAWVTDYVNAWLVAVEKQPELALMQTVEVRGLAGEQIGLIVLPGHPLLVAWRHAYDELAYHARFAEELSANDVVKTLASLDLAYFPLFLPGLVDGESFVFGDTLGDHAVAMLRSGEREPQAAIARLARCLAAGGTLAAPSVGSRTGEVIGKEIRRYQELHKAYSLLRIHAMRPGDGLTLTRALGAARKSSQTDDEEDAPQSDRGYLLDLHPSDSGKAKRELGRYLVECTEQRRAGGRSIPEQDRWLLDTCVIAGATLPALRWSKRTKALPDSPAHVSVAFDTFDSRVGKAPDTLPTTSPREAYGLSPSQIREFYGASDTSNATWFTTLAQAVDGDKHPASRGLSERLLEAQKAVMKVTASHLGMESDAWPALVTEVSEVRDYELQRLHELSDWVIAVDRNAGIEYFDEPHTNPDVYERYVIDCVPERQDLDTVQLITSTSHVDEVKQLLETTLQEMAVTASTRNCECLLSELKGLSGRLAMRLAGQPSTRSELIALALLHRNCVSARDERHFFPLESGFFVPLDDVVDLLQLDPVTRRPRASKSSRSPGETGSTESSDDPRGNLRSDLVYVSASRREGLTFRFVEVKYRRLLRTARSGELLEQMRNQIAATRKGWQTTYLNDELKPTQKAIHRKRLARALRFYLKKAHRHHLSDESFTRLSKEIDRLFQPSHTPSVTNPADRAYVFCPEHLGPPEEVDPSSPIQTILFGPTSLPDAGPDGPGSREYEPTADRTPVETASSRPPAARTSPIAATPDPTLQQTQTEPGPTSSLPPETPESPTPEAHPETHPETPSILRVTLGEQLASDEPVHWPLSLQGNPHLMLVGLPGMGKTTCLINLCTQLAAQGVTPIVFSYHQDLDEKLQDRLGNVTLLDVESGLGFNPMRVEGQGRNAWIDNIGMLRDIFAAIYPELGDLQTNEIREALRECYRRAGFGSEHAGEAPEPPAFQSFFDILFGKPKPNLKLKARLDELNDYGFFRSHGDGTGGSLLASSEPVVLRLHTTQSDVLQNATASFALFKLYQNMFQRGVQTHLTHAVIFDEAHRASRLKLLPKMAKECRKYGISLVIASQEAKDFNESLFSAIANYLVLRVNSTDADALARNFSGWADGPRIAGRLKLQEKYSALLVAEGQRPAWLRLLPS